MLSEFQLHMCRSESPKHVCLVDSPTPLRLVGEEDLLVGEDSPGLSRGSQRDAEFREGAGAVLGEFYSGARVCTHQSKQ